MTTRELCGRLISPGSCFGSVNSPEQMAIGVALGRKMIAAGSTCIHQHASNISRLVLLDPLGRAYIPVTMTCEQIEDILDGQNASVPEAPVASGLAVETLAETDRGFAEGDRVAFTGSDGEPAEGDVNDAIPASLCIRYTDVKRRHLYTYRHPNVVRLLAAAPVPNERLTADPQ